MVASVALTFLRFENALFRERTMPCNDAVLNVVSQVGLSYKQPFCKRGIPLLFRELYLRG